MKIFLDPNPGRRPDRADGGVRRVLDAQIKYLPEFGIKVTRKIEDADLTVGHIDRTPIAQGKPFVSHCHGLMWSSYFPQANEAEVNARVVNALLQADAITAPSKWVANALSYGMLRTPKVIYHGVDVDEWQVSENQGDYVLWNKARADAVSNPQDLITLAAQMPNIKFVSTLGTQTKNVKLCGVVPYQQHKALIMGAGVYLATARETFGIGTLEALASGVPVAGWDYGGQSEIIIPGETGYLAPYGDYAALAECVNKCLKDRKRLSENARADVLKRWQWIDKIEQYANLYKQVYNSWNEPRPKVSVIVPCHNLAKYLPDALMSVKAQTFQHWECLIIDDASTDNTKEIAESFINADHRFCYFTTGENLKLSRTLNYGHGLARGKYVVNLDADNMLPEDALEIQVNALDTRRDLHIVFGALDTMSDDGTNRKANAFPYPVYENFSWHGQIAHLNQLHSSAMMRAEVWKESNGWRERQWRAEDAEFWTRVSSFGFRIERVTDKPTLIYRWRVGSKSMIESQQNADKDGDWVEYFPWRTAKNADEGKKQIATNPQMVANPNLVPFGAQGKRADATFWNVYHRQEPLVSVIIPVGPGHTRFLNDALDSLVGQMMNEWEAVVVNDTGDCWEAVPGAPYARVFKTKGKQGAGAARNVGLAHARGKLVFFLDADDMLDPTALVKMTQRYARGDCGYVYCDATVPTSPRTNSIRVAPEFTQEGWLKRGIHSQAVLMATEDARRVGGFDEAMPAWEDWDFFVKCVVAGICGERVAEPLLLYRKHLGKRSAYGDERRADLFRELQIRYHDFTDGSKKLMPCGGCGSKAALAAIRNSRIAQARVETLEKPVQPGYVRIKYTGAKIAPVTYYANGHPYPAANTSKWKFLDVPATDAEVLLGMPIFVKVNTVSIVAPEPAPVPVVAPPEPPKPVIPPPPKPIDAEAMQAAVEAMEKVGGFSDVTKMDANKRETIVSSDKTNWDTSEVTKAAKQIDDKPKAKRARKAKAVAQ